MVSIDRSICYTSGLGEPNLSVKCSGYRDDVKMTKVEITYPDKGIILALHYCSKVHDLVRDLHLNNAFQSNLVVELKGYYALEPYLSEKRHKGLPPKVLKSILPTLKENGYRYIIMHAAGDGGLVGMYESLGFANAGVCPPHLEEVFMEASDHQYDQLIRDAVMDKRSQSKLPGGSDLVFHTFDPKKPNILSPSGFNQNYLIGDIDVVQKALERYPDLELHLSDSPDCIGDEEYEILSTRCKGNWS